MNDSMPEIIVKGLLLGLAIGMIIYVIFGVYVIIKCIVLNACGITWAL